MHGATIKIIHDNPSRKSRVVPCGRADGQADMTKLVIAFHNFTNAPIIIIKAQGKVFPCPRREGVEGQQDYNHACFNLGT